MITLWLARQISALSLRVVDGRTVFYPDGARGPGHVLDGAAQVRVRTGYGRALLALFVFAAAMNATRPFLPGNPLLFLWLLLVPPVLGLIAFQRLKHRWVQGLPVVRTPMHLGELLFVPFDLATARGLVQAVLLAITIAMVVVVAGLALWDRTYGSALLVVMIASEIFPDLGGEPTRRTWMPVSLPKPTRSRSIRQGLEGAPPGSLADRVDQAIVRDDLALQQAAQWAEPPPFPGVIPTFLPALLPARLGGRVVRALAIAAFMSAFLLVGAANAYSALYKPMGIAGVAEMLLYGTVALGAAAIVWCSARATPPAHWAQTGLGVIALLLVGAAWVGSLMHFPAIVYPPILAGIPTGGLLAVTLLRRQSIRRQALDDAVYTAAEAAASRAATAYGANARLGDRDRF